MKVYHHDDTLEAGVDEAGAGCLSGPVFAAAVVWPNFMTKEMLKDNRWKLVKDSKKLNLGNRILAREFVEKYAIAFSIESLSNEYIDKHNILNSRLDCMHKALDSLDIVPEMILVDGDKFKKYNEIEHICIKQGDNKYMSIAAASILAKTERDNYMVMLDDPGYGWSKNKGYGTKEHYEAIGKLGVHKLHRKTFRLF
jgi:ribonuclease HII